MENKIVICLLILLSGLNANAQTKATSGYDEDFESFEYYDCLQGEENIPWTMENTSYSCHDIIVDDNNNGNVLQIWSDYAGSSIVSSLVDATLLVDIDSRESGLLSFDLRIVYELQNYLDGDPISEEISSSDQDGLYMSDDGGLTYVKVDDINYKDIGGEWISKSYSLNDLAFRHNLTLNSDFRVKFQVFAAWGQHPICGYTLFKYLQIDNVKLESYGSSAERPYRISYQYDDAGNQTDKIITLEYTLKSSYSKPVDVEEELGEQSVIVTPNPTKGVIKIIISNGDPEDIMNYQLYSLTGSLMYEEDFVADGEHPIHMEGYVDGVYLLTISNGVEKVTYKIIKH